MEKEMVERIRELADTMDNMQSEKCSGCAYLLRSAFPEAFLPEKHEAIAVIDALLKDMEESADAGWSKRLQYVRSAFNDDGSLKK